jgi:hypothetical protein
MRTLDEIEKSAREQSPFSNGDIGYGWMANWCDRCLVDAPFRNGISPRGCPIIMVALLGKTPIEWIEQPDRIQDYLCIEARFPGGGGGEPRPKPEPPQMDGLFPRPNRGVRMYVQPEPVDAPIREAV